MPPSGQTTVAETCVVFFVEDQLQFYPLFGQEFPADVEDAKVQEVVLERAPDQILEREIVEFFEPNRSKRAFVATTFSTRMSRTARAVTRYQSRGDIRPRCLAMLYRM